MCKDINIFIPMKIREQPILLCPLPISRSTNLIKKNVLQFSFKGWLPLSRYILTYYWSRQTGFHSYGIIVEKTPKYPLPLQMRSPLFATKFLHTSVDLHHILITTEIHHAITCRPIFCTIDFVIDPVSWMQALQHLLQRFRMFLNSLHIWNFGYVFEFWGVQRIEKQTPYRSTLSSFISS